MKIIKKISKDLKEIKQTLNESSYYPELKRKSKFFRKIELLFRYFLFPYPEKFYNLYGLDIKKKKTSNYIHHEKFRRDRERMNKTDSSYSLVLKDKILFSFYLSLSHKTKVISNESYVLNGELGNINLLPDGDYFFKKVDGELGDDVYYIEKRNNQFFYNDALTNLQELIKNRRFVVQKKIIQHPQIAQFNVSSANTIRLVTIKRGGNVHVLSSVLRAGAYGLSVDNWAKGGLAIGINKEDGTLKKWGFSKPEKDSKRYLNNKGKSINFEGVTIPFYKEAEDICIEAHKMLQNVHSIGWDVVITENGPLILEGNDNWEISLMQACDGGLKNEFYKK